MDVLECLNLQMPQDGKMLERFYNELMIPNFPLKEASRTLLANCAAMRFAAKLCAWKSCSLFDVDLSCFS